jgi:membrane-associated phospholipid phosphatase
MRCHDAPMRVLCIVLLLLSTSACTTLPNGRGWGQDATFTPGWERIKTSASDAARDPWVWAPLAGAAVFQIDDWDRRTADWAQEQTPVFGSQRSAENWSDDLRTASSLVHYATLAATPSGDTPREWLINKAKGTLVSVAAVSGTVLVTQTLKTTVDRERPNGQGTESFPSGHTSSSAVHTRLASRNLESIEMSHATRASLNVGLYALTIGTSWARIEAGWHYPADTLFSIALGNFFASFVNDAFLGLDQEDAQLAVAPLDGGGLLQFSVRF